MKRGFWAQGLKTTTLNTKKHVFLKISIMSFLDSSLKFTGTLIRHTILPKP